MSATEPEVPAPGPAAVGVEQLSQFRGRSSPRGVAVPPPASVTTPSRRRAIEVVRPRVEHAPTPERRFESGVRRRHEHHPRGAGRLSVGRVEPWSVMRMAILFNVSIAVMVMVASLVVWLAADQVGLVGNLEEFGRDLGFVDFQLLPTTMLRALAAMAGICTVVGTFFAVVWAVLFNLITDVTGGVEISLRRRVGSEGG